MKRIMQGSLLALLLNLVTGLAIAAAIDDFKAGQKAFKAGDYQKALSLFQKARRSGMKNAAVHYNIGVTYYKLGRYAEAEKAFLETARYPKMASLAWYNLGLVRLAQGDKKAAREWFAKARKETDDPKLRALADQQLAGLKSRWRSFAYAGIGYDDNITLTSDVITVPTGKSDGFVELYAHTRGILSGSLRDGVLLRAGAFGDFYFDLTNYNYTEINGGIYKTLPLGQWATEGGLRISQSNYGGTGYLQIASLILGGKRNLSRQTRLELRFRLRNLNSVEDRYDYLSGSSYDLRVGARWRTGKTGSLRAYYQFQDNDRNDFRTATEFHSLSPQRHRVRVTWRNRIGENWKIRLAGEYRKSLYKDENVYNSGAIRVKREDDRLRALAEVTRMLNRKTDLVFSYVYTDNASNLTLPGIVDYDYTRNMFLASVQYMF